MISERDERAVSRLVHRSALALDDKDFAAFLDLCDPEFRYVVTTYSPEIRRPMTWLDHDRAGMQTLFDTLARHNSDASELSRHVTVCTIDTPVGAAGVEVVSTLQVLRTGRDGGQTELFAAGRLHDTVRLGESGPRLLRREVRLRTRMLGIGHHIPF